ncbi:hypothetical protein SK066_16435 [Paenibacillus hunanensis]|nr:hypothetical protein [Paenibacillus hunanensis]WPP40190.1 hypothetical protein SK066_16435 [Paenibacillus hunanensis]
MILSLIGLVSGCTVLAAIVWCGVYLCMQMSNEPIRVKPIRSADDWFE